MTRFYPFLSLVAAVLFFLYGALSDERTGLYPIYRRLGGHYGKETPNPPSSSQLL
jgi:hypothetical protein